MEEKKEIIETYRKFFNEEYYKQVHRKITSLHDDVVRMHDAVLVLKSYDILDDSERLYYNSVKVFKETLENYYESLLEKTFKILRGE